MIIFVVQGDGDVQHAAESVECGCMACTGDAVGTSVALLEDALVCIRAFGPGAGVSPRDRDQAQHAVEYALQCLTAQSAA